MHRAKHSILFVCTANQCRSPLAAALFQRQLGETVDRWSIASAGTWAKSGIPAHPLTQAAAAQIYDLNLKTHRSQSIDKLSLTDYRLILAMAQGHKEAICAEFPAVAQSVYLLSEMVGMNFDIADPVQGDLALHMTTLRQIDGLLERGMARINQLVGYSE